MKKFISTSIVLSLLLSLFTFTVSANETVSVLINRGLNFEYMGKEFIPYDEDINSIVYPITYNDRTYIPARFLAEAIGFTVTWDGETQTVGFNDGGVEKVNEAKHGDRTPYYDTALLNKGIKFTVNREPFVPKEDDGSICYPLTYKDRTYIPARFIAEKAGLSVEWVAETQTIKLDYADTYEEVEVNVPTRPSGSGVVAPPAEEPADEPEEEPTEDAPTEKLGLENYGFELWRWKPHAGVVKFTDSDEGDKLAYIPGPIELIGKPLTFVEYAQNSSFFKGLYSNSLHFDFSTGKNILWVDNDYSKQSYLEAKFTGDVQEYKKALVQFAKDNFYLTDTITKNGKEYLPLLTKLIYEFDNDSMKIIVCDSNIFSYIMSKILG